MEQGKLTVLGGNGLSVSSISKLQTIPWIQSVTAETTARCHAQQIVWRKPCATAAACSVLTAQHTLSMQSALEEMQERPAVLGSCSAEINLQDLVDMLLTPYKQHTSDLCPPQGQQQQVS